MACAYARAVMLAFHISIVALLLLYFSSWLYLSSLVSVARVIRTDVSKQCTNLLIVSFLLFHAFELDDVFPIQ